MTSFIGHLPHLIIALAVIGAASALGAEHVIAGATAVALIAAAGGFSLGGAVASILTGQPPSSGTAPTAAPTASAPTQPVAAVPPPAASG